MNQIRGQIDFIESNVAKLSKSVSAKPVSNVREVRSNPDQQLFDDFASNMTDFIEDIAKSKIHMLAIPSVGSNDFMAANQSSTLGKKMDILAWTINAMPILLENTVQTVLNTFRTVEIPLEHTLQ